MSHVLTVHIVLLFISLNNYFHFSMAAGRRLSRNRASNLLLPPDAIIYTNIVSRRSECLALLAHYRDGCCTIYNNVTRNCTVARTDRFQLVSHADASLEVGIDKDFTTCLPNPESAVLNAQPPSWLSYTRRKGSVSIVSFQCINTTQTKNKTLTCAPNGTWQVAEFENCYGDSRIFNMSGNFTFIVPHGVSLLRAIAIGGGGGGTNGHQPGGGGGYINCSSVAVASGQSIAVSVGVGGTGAASSTISGTIIGNTDGGASSFGTYVVASGGSSCGVYVVDKQYGCAGGTGSGGNCWGLCPVGVSGGNGGSGGGNGTSTLPANISAGGVGMGSAAYSTCLNVAKLHQLSAGAGGLGGSPLNGAVKSWSAGGGGGGVLLDGRGPAAAAQSGAGTSGIGATGGIGFGAGGGAGGASSAIVMFAGGNGANGIVYLEWD